MAGSGRHAPAGHHRGDTATHTPAQTASAPPAAAPVRRGAGPRAVRRRPRSRTARARFRHPPGRGTPAASGAPGRTTPRGRHEQSAVIVVTPIEPGRGPTDDLVLVSGHPPFQPGVTRVLLRVRQTRDQCGLPSAPMRTRSRVSRPSPDSGAGWCSSSTRQGPYLRARPARIRPADSVTEVRPPVSWQQPGNPETQPRWPRHAGARPFPRQAPGRVLPERVINEHLAEAAEGHPRRRASVRPSVMVVPGRQRGTSSPVRSGTREERRSSPALFLDTLAWRASCGAAVHGGVGVTVVI
jgi:hypothetical protein